MRMAVRISMMEAHHVTDLPRIRQFSERNFATKTTISTAMGLLHLMYVVWWVKESAAASRTQRSKGVLD